MSSSSSVSSVVENITTTILSRLPQFFNQKLPVQECNRLFSIDLLLNLPPSVIVSIFMDWIDIDEYVVFDAALCNHVHRKTLLDIFSNCTYGFNTKRNISSTKYFMWLTSRMVKVKKVNYTRLGTGSLEKSIFFILESNGVNQIRSLDLRFNQLLTVPGVLNGIYQTFAQKYPHLKELRIRDFEQLPNGFHYTFLSNMVCTLKLESLNVSYSAELSNEMVTHLLENCSTLTELDISHCVNIDDNAFMSIKKFSSNSSSAQKMVSYENTTTSSNITAAELNSSFVVMDASLIVQEYRTSKTSPNVKIIPLTSLNISGNPLITDRSVLLIALCCPKLQSFSINSTPLRRINVHNDSLQALSIHCPQLKHLDIGGCQRINDETIVQLITHCPALESLGFNDCSQLNTQSLNQISTITKQLTTLQLRGFVVRGSIISETLRHFNKLIELDISCCTNILDHDAWQIAKSCPLLERIDMSQCARLTSQSIISMVEGCSKLSNIGLEKFCGGITSTAMRKIGENCGKNLLELNLNSNYLLPYGSLYFIGLYCTQLTNLQLYCCDYVNDLDVMRIAEKCPHLKQINIGIELLRDENKRHEVTSQSVLKLAECCQYLMVINFKGRERIQDHAIVTLAYNCPNLYSVDLNGCNLITDASVIALAKRCPSLSYLCVSSCPFVTSASVYSLGSSGVPLRSFHYICCNQISDHSIVDLVKQCHTLMEINKHRNWVNQIRAAISMVDHDQDHTHGPDTNSVISLAHILTHWNQN